MTHHGMIKWYVQGELIMEFTAGKKSTTVKQTTDGKSDVVGKDDTGFRIIFGRSINEKDIEDDEIEDEDEEMDCKALLADFVERLGGRKTCHDPEYEKCRKVVESIWEAGKKIYGKPSVESMVNTEVVEYGQIIEYLEHTEHQEAMEDEEATEDLQPTEHQALPGDQGITREKIQYGSQNQREVRGFESYEPTELFTRRSRIWKKSKRVWKKLNDAGRKAVQMLYGGGKRSRVRQCSAI